MNIVEAMDAMDRGEKLRHESFGDGQYCTKSENGGYLVSGKYWLPLCIGTAEYANMLRGGWSIAREQFGFMEAYKRARAGKRVCRASRPSSSCTLFYCSRHGSLRYEPNGPSMLATEENIEATDWEEVP